eukprot:TRINITY_DN45481_c0_g1_i2.p1 TRINITY_DN45481_c0_g1~~TRINITY_DN45481_c0_g1_i2.p1  ORF type:complete len:306 (-),score=61.13 TRINITY_DN45481_c0_g1_i2:106-1023(-)
MKTAKVIVQKTRSSPRILLSVSALLLFGLAVLHGTVRTETLMDDLVVAAIVALLLTSIYLQADWAIGLAERVEPNVVWRIPVKENRAALTIDDVPLLDNPSNLKEILDVLKKHKVTATLFIMSGFDLPVEEGGMPPKDREQCHELLKRAVAEGHELANHMLFDRPAIALSDQEFTHAFEHCDKLIAGLQGGSGAWKARSRRWFRPASAMWSQHMLEMASSKGYTCVISNCFPFDTAAATRFLNAPYLRSRVRPGSVVVVHDRWHTPETLDKALPVILNAGVKLSTLSELQAVADAERAEKGGKQS